MIAEFAGMNGPSLRNALTNESRLDVLRELATDKRKIVADKAQRRLAQLGVALGDGLLDNTGTFDGPTTSEGIALAETETPAPTGEDPFDRAKREVLEKHGIKSSKRPKKEPPPVLESKPEAERKRTSRRKNLKQGTDDGGTSDGLQLGEHAPQPAQPSPSPEVEGTSPASEASAPVKVRRLRREPSPEFLAQWEGKEKRCPHCHEMLDIVTGFGPRTVGGTKAHPGDRQIPQPWCFDCRARAGRESVTNPKREATKKAVAARATAKAARLKSKENGA